MLRRPQAQIFYMEGLVTCFQDIKIAVVNFKFYFALPALQHVQSKPIPAINPAITAIQAGPALFYHCICSRHGGNAASY